MAAYYAGLQFNAGNIVTNYINEAYPHICTCTEDSITIQAMMGVDSTDYETADKMAALDTCSESGAAYAKQTKYKKYMGTEVDKTDTDWNKIANYVIREADADYDGYVSTAEIIDALAYQYEISPTEDEKTYLVEEFDGYCNTHATRTTSGTYTYNSTQLATCLTESGQAIWDGSKELEAEKQREAADPDQANANLTAMINDVVPNAADAR